MDRTNKNNNMTIFYLLNLFFLFILVIFSLVNMFIDTELYNMVFQFSIICWGYLLISNIATSGGMFDLTNPIFLMGSFYFAFFGISSIIVGPNILETALLNKSLMGIIIGWLGILLANFLSVTSFWSYKLPMSRFSKNILLKSKRFEIILFIIGASAAILNIALLGYIPLLQGNLEQTRVDASTSISGGLRILVLLLIMAANISALNYWENLKENNVRSKGSLFRWIICIILLSLFANRSPIFNVFLTTGYLYLITFNKFKLKIGSFISLTIIGLIACIIFIGGVGAYRVLNTEEFLNYPEFRPYVESNNYIGLATFTFFHYFTIALTNFQGVLRVFPDLLNFQLGKSYVMPILTALPGTQYTLDMQVKNALGQTYKGGGTIPTFLGEAYANFGLLGIFVIPFITVVILTIYRKKLFKDNNMKNRLIFVYLVLWLCAGQLSGYAATNVMSYINILVLVMYSFYVSGGKNEK